MSSWVLASTSPWRRQLLEAAGLSFEALAPEVDERALEAQLRAAQPELSPEALVLALAAAKARDVAARAPGLVVVGADQALALGSDILGKPADAAAAHHQLSKMAGKTHRLLTGVALVGGGFDDTTFVERTDLTLRDLTDREITQYVETGEWRGCAGGYRIEGQGLGLMARIEGDYHNIIGLPMLALLRALRARGLATVGRPLLRHDAPR